MRKIKLAKSSCLIKKDDFTAPVIRQRNTSRAAIFSAGNFSYFVALQCGNNEAEMIVMEGEGACVGTLPHLLSTRLRENTQS